MPDKTYNIASDADSTLRWWHDYFGIWQWNAYGAIMAGAGAAYGYGSGYETSLLFKSIDIPKGAIIDSAHIHYRCPSAESYYTVSDVDIQACDEDDSAIITSISDFDRTRTTASVRYQVTMEEGTEYQTPDLKDVVQEIIDRSGWASGNDIQFVLTDHNYKYPNHKSGDDGTGGFVAGDLDSVFNISLDIAYHMPASGGFAEII